MFGGAYDHAATAERPKYGSLNYDRRPAGGSVRFGSSHLVVARHVLRRTTFCYPDSSTEPTDFGTAEHMPLIPLTEAGDFDVLGDHIEAHVHGPLRLDRDIEALVLDPSFRGTDVADAADALPFPVRWHHGFRLHVDELAKYSGFRGEQIVRAGTRIAEDGWLDARVIGDAVRAGRYDGQTLKRVRHCTARFGHRWHD